MDGLSDFGILWRIVLPLSSIIVVVLAIVNFPNIWNELLYAIVIGTVKYGKDGSARAVTLQFHIPGVLAKYFCGPCTYFPSDDHLLYNLPEIHRQSGFRGRDQRLSIHVLFEGFDRN